MTQTQPPNPPSLPLVQSLEQMRVQFLKQLGTRIEAIEAEAGRLVRGDWSVEGARRLQLLIHSLAGSAGTFGAPLLSQAARHLEYALSPYLDKPPTEKTARVALNRCVMEVIYLAQDVQQRKRASAPASKPEIETNEPLIYIVEDDRTLSIEIAEYLLHAGYTTQIFETPGELLESANLSKRPQAVVMNFMKDGADNSCARALSEYRSASCQEIPAIVIASRNDIEARLSALRSGATRYLTKPLNFERLVRTLDDLTDCRVHDPYRVLLVDDDKDHLQFSAAILQSAGMRTQELAHSLQIFAAAEEFNPDVIVLDVHMPEISGIELAALLRGEDRFAHVPILFLSGETDVRQKLLALDLGGDDFLLKPIDPSHLIAAVRTRAKRARHSQIVSENLRRIVREKEYQEYALNQHAIVSVANHAGTIIRVNEKFCEVSGYNASELIGQNHRIVKSNHHPNSFYVEMWDTICTGKVWHGVVCNRRKDGNLYWVDSTIVPLMDEQGLPYQYISIRTDVTHIKQVELALLKERHLTNAAINALPGIFYIISAENRFLRINENFSKITGYTAQEALTMTPLDLFDTQHQAYISSKIQDVFLHGYGYAETQLLTKNGAHIPFYFQGATVEIDGQACLIGTGTDITKIKEYQTALIAAKDEAESANRAKSRFLSNMSHELRTPLNSIIGFAQLAEVDATLNADQRDNFNEILRAGRHLLELINEVLDLAKVESGRIDISISPVPCATLVIECVSLIQPIADQRAISIAWQAPADLSVRADRKRLKQTIINLLSNAVKYNRPSGEARIEVHALSEEFVRISISDTGTGIPEARLKELFHPFQRLISEHAPIEGTGIGLTISKNLIEAMGGKIGVKSMPGIGSTFWIDLPIERSRTQLSEEIESPCRKEMSDI